MSAWGGERDFGAGKVLGTWYLGDGMLGAVVT